MGATRTSPSQEPALIEAACDGHQETDGRLAEGRRMSAVTAFARPEVFRRLARPEGPYVDSELFARFGMPPELLAR